MDFMGKTRPRRLLLIVLAALAGCAKPEPAKPKLPAPLAKVLGPSGRVNAAGEAPMWSAQVRPGLIRIGLDSATPLTAGISAFSQTPRAASWSGTTADKVRLRVVVEARPCRDGETNLVYPLSAKAEVGAQTVYGCAAAPGGGLGPRD
jgi:uncharacterized membrane protein